ncbi:hypothetical protein IKZ40_00040 [bacterium]|nr:hypothetical protein [bacterium]
MRNVLCLTGALTLLLAGCASLPPYETEDWRLAIVDSDTAEATVRYEGFCSPSNDAATREKYVETLKEMAEDKEPGTPFTPRMKNARRYFLVENDSLIMVEQGEIPNPLSWFEQSGLNPMTWFGSDVNMSVKDGHVIKWGFASENEIVAASGQVMNERDYSRVLTALDNRNVTTDPQEWESDGQTIIVWPGETRAFNWKVASRGYLKNYRSLAYEFSGQEYAVEPALKVSDVISEASGEAPETSEAFGDESTVTSEVQTIETLDPEPEKEDAFAAPQKEEAAEKAEEGKSAFDL